MDWTGPNVAAVTGGALLLSFVVERAVMPRLRPSWWFRMGFPLGSQLRAIPRPPEGSGRTASVFWEVRDDRVVFWADPANRAAPTGLHGSVGLVRGPNGWEIPVTFSPPWTGIVASAWMALLGILRGEPQIGGLLGALLVLVIVFAYRTAAVRAAAELRWSFVRQTEVEPP